MFCNISAFIDFILYKTMHGNDIMIENLSRTSHIMEIYIYLVFNKLIGIIQQGSTGLCCQFDFADVCIIKIIILISTISTMQETRWSIIIAKPMYVKYLTFIQMTLKLLIFCYNYQSTIYNKISVWYHKNL